MPKQTIFKHLHAQVVSRDFLSAADGTVEHGKNAFRDELPETGRPLAHMARLSWHATKPLFKPTTGPAILDKPDVIRIGISIAAGNKAKTVLRLSGSGIVDQLADLPCEFYVFGAPNEQSWMDDIPAFTVKSLILLILLANFARRASTGPFQRWTAISRLTRGMSISQTPSACRWSCCFGPCCHYEQRPLGNVMLIGNDDNICSYVFETRYYFTQEREALFSVTDSALHDLQQFVRTLPKAPLTGG